jgi:CHAT domain-containing protein
VHLVIAPDGELNQVPFEALVSPTGRFVVEDYLLSYVTVGRDVVQWGVPAVGSSSAIIVADPDYDLGAETATAEASGVWRQPRGNDVTTEPGAERAAGDHRRQRLLRQVQEDTEGFDRLPHTRPEGKAVKRLLRTRGIDVVACWMDKDALEQRLKAVHKPMILHLATHGFFLPNPATPARQQWAAMFTAQRGGLGALASPLGGSRYVENPLVRSGLVFAGVNSAFAGQSLPAEAEDGVVTALDVLTMDLLGTELITLSACQTGQGEVRRGEGVMGLRRACTLAGARTLVMSLWTVPDKETRWLMRRMYANLLRGMGKAAALRQAQLDLIAHLRAFQGHDHPYFWAAFICQGDPAPLAAREWNR